jgi:hypothetical protein
VIVDGDRAVGESYCMAYQLWDENGERKMQILSIRYLDRFVREGEGWLFAERQLIIDWSDTRTSQG